MSTDVRHDVLSALMTVEDPELHRSIVELQMVRGIDVNSGVATVMVALTVAGCPMRAEITRRVTEAVALVEGISKVNVELGVMTPEELDQVRAIVSGGGQSTGSTSSSPSSRSAHAFKNARVIGVTSGKGGVGKSSVTVNLATTLAKRGYDVALIDADVYGFSVPSMLGIVGEPEMAVDKLLPPQAHGVRCISLGFFVDDAQPVVWRGPMLHKALDQFISDVEWGAPDFVLIDMPPGTGDVALSMAEYLPRAEIVVVTTPQPAAQRVAQRTGFMAKQMNLPLLGVIENMSWFTGDDNKRYELFGVGGGEALSAALDTTLLGSIPLVPALREGGDQGMPISVQDPSSEPAHAFEEIVNAIEKHAPPRRVYHDELHVKR